MNTQEAVSIIKEFFSSKHLGICSMGRTAEEVYLNINNCQVLFLDCMGCVTGTAIGVALGCQEIWVDALDTDGSFMYSLSILHIIAAKKEELKKLTIFIFDNQMLESGGGWSSRHVDLNWISLCNAWSVSCIIIEDVNKLKKLMVKRKYLKEPQIVVLKIRNRDILNTCSKNIDGRESKYMFKRYINDNMREGVVKPCMKN
jgi:Thiamine pyrophosphate-requiring enzymes [acetolactate synthase, pyruvate dehydrogenase (cytochrome), glyoxylate carboligase, phosphonopyruvate decarboxylase]